MTFVFKLVIFTLMINKFKYVGYDEDGVEAYLCLNCYESIRLRHHHSVQVLTFCPYCGCKFEGAFIKDNKNEFLYKDEDGYNRSKLYDLNSKDFKMQWRVEKRNIIHWGNDILGDKKWEQVYSPTFDKSFSERERALYTLRYNMKLEEDDDDKFFGDKEVTEFRLVYYKNWFHKPKEIISYYYPKNNKIVKIYKEKVCA